MSLLSASSLRVASVVCLFVLSVLVVSSISASFPGAFKFTMALELQQETLSFVLFCFGLVC